MRAGFSETDITPPPGTKKGGWMQDIEAEVVLDPLFARIAVFDNGCGKVAFIQLDLLSIRWSDTNDIRSRIEQIYGFPGGNIMVAASHNHAGPAIARLAPVERQDEYLADMKDKCVRAFGVALDNMQEAVIGRETVFEFDVAFNRRTVMRDGTVKTQMAYTNREALYQEGPIDPEVAVCIVRSDRGELLGAMVNFACHPTHHGGSNEISAGFPGVLAAKAKKFGIPVCLFLNGAYGNVITNDFQHGKSLSKEEAGDKLFRDLDVASSRMAFNRDIELAVAAATLELSFRNITVEERKGLVKGAQRFRDDELYETEIDHITKKIEHCGKQLAEIQVIKFGDWYFVGVPAEYFVEFQLQIKTAVYPRWAFVVGGANGMLGYVPTKAAFARGGYETTLGPPSRMAPETGDIIADNIIEQIQKM